MTDDTLIEEHRFDLTKAKRYDWLHAIDDMGEERGYCEEIGAHHSAILTDNGPTLIVTFETIDTIRQGDTHMPMGWALADDNDWSNLCILAHKNSWFRDNDLYGYFDRLVDDGFFEDFDNVVFYGAGMCGYAAAAFSVVAPEATVIAIEPQATLDPARTGWDNRFPKMRRTNFTNRYGYAPDMVEAADAVYILHTLDNIEDSMHASLFTGTNIHHIPCRRMGEHLSAELISMGVVSELITNAAAGVLTPTVAFKAMRARREHLPYLRAILELPELQGRPALIAALARHVTDRRIAPRFRRALEQAEKVLENTE